MSTKNNTSKTKSKKYHTLVLETDLSYQDKCKVFHNADLLRKAGNELVAIMKNNYEQLIRTKKYRKLKDLYIKYKDEEDIESKDKIKKQMNEMQKKYNVTMKACRTYMQGIYKKYGLHSKFARTKADSIWKAVKKCLYSNGKTIHFKKRGDLPSLRAEASDEAIIIRRNDDKLQFKWNKLTFGAKIKDRFEKDEVNEILNYISQTEKINKQVVEKFKVCYATLVCKMIRGKLRVYVHICIEGNAIPKYDRNGNIRHKLGTGIIGCDIGTQTIAYTSDNKVGLKNLAERGRSIFRSERKEWLLYRAMDRSRRAMNPQNYNTDGTIKKGHKNWTYSKRYKKLKSKHTELCRIDSINRHLAINEDVNYLRSIGNVFVTEPNDVNSWQKRGKTTKNNKGKFNRKKRFGKSIKNRCPGYFKAKAEQKFINTGGEYIEVPKYEYRASQYDHTNGEYIKKKCHIRMYKLSDGNEVQRDWYSSFLLYCVDYDLYKKSGDIIRIDLEKCKNVFNIYYEKEKECINQIKNNKIKVLNSGIKY